MTLLNETIKQLPEDWDGIHLGGTLIQITWIIIQECYTGVIGRAVDMGI